MSKAEEKVIQEWEKMGRKRKAGDEHDFRHDTSLMTQRVIIEYEIQQKRSEEMKVANERRQKEEIKKHEEIKKKEDDEQKKWEEGRMERVDKWRNFIEKNGKFVKGL